MINPEDIAIYRALAGGVTAANILHGSANSIGGQTIVLKMRWGKDAQGHDFRRRDAGDQVRAGRKSEARRKSAGRTRRLRATNLPAIRRPAWASRTRFARRSTKPSHTKPSGTRTTRRCKSGEHPIPPRKDLKLEALKEVLEGKRFVHAHCYRADEILMLIRVADDYGFKIRTFQHVLEGYKVAKEIAAHGAGGSTFSDWWGLQGGSLSTRFLTTPR